MNIDRLWHQHPEVRQRQLKSLQSKLKLGLITSQELLNYPGIVQVLRRIKVEDCSSLAHEVLVFLGDDDGDEINKNYNQIDEIKNQDENKINEIKYQDENKINEIKKQDENTINEIKKQDENTINEIKNQVINQNEIKSKDQNLFSLVDNNFPPCYSKSPPQTNLSQYLAKEYTMNPQTPIQFASLIENINTVAFLSEPNMAPVLWQQLIETPDIGLHCMSLLLPRLTRDVKHCGCEIGSVIYFGYQTAIRVVGLAVWHGYVYRCARVMGLLLDFMKQFCDDLTDWSMAVAQQYIPSLERNKNDSILFNVLLSSLKQVIFSCKDYKVLMSVVEWFRRVILMELFDSDEEQVWCVAGLHLLLDDDEEVRKKVAHKFGEEEFDIMRGEFSNNDLNNDNFNANSIDLSFIKSSLFSQNLEIRLKAKEIIRTKVYSTDLVKQILATDYNIKLTISSGNQSNIIEKISKSRDHEECHEMIGMYRCMRYIEENNKNYTEPKQLSIVLSRFFKLPPATDDDLLLLIHVLALVRECKGIGVGLLFDLINSLNHKDNYNPLYTQLISDICSTISVLPIPSPQPLLTLMASVNNSYLRRTLIKYIKTSGTNTVIVQFLINRIINCQANGTVTSEYIDYISALSLCCKDVDTQQLKPLCYIHGMITSDNDTVAAIGWDILADIAASSGGMELLLEQIPNLYSIAVDCYCEKKWSKILSIVTECDDRLIRASESVYCVIQMVLDRGLSVKPFVPLVRGLMQGSFEDEYEKYLLVVLIGRMIEQGYEIDCSEFLEMIIEDCHDDDTINISTISNSLIIISSLKQFAPSSPLSFFNRLSSLLHLVSCIHVYTQLFRLSPQIYDEQVYEYSVQHLTEHYSYLHLIKLLIERRESLVDSRLVYQLKGLCESGSDQAIHLVAVLSRYKRHMWTPLVPFLVDNGHVACLSNLVLPLNYVEWLVGAFKSAPTAHLCTMVRRMAKVTEGRRALLKHGICSVCMDYITESIKNKNKNTNKNSLISCLSVTSLVARYKDGVASMMKHSPACVSVLFTVIQCNQSNTPLVTKALTTLTLLCQELKQKSHFTTVGRN